MNLYPYFREKALDSSHADNVDLVNDPIKIALVAGGSYDSTDKYLSDLTADAGVTVVTSSPALASKTVAGGTFDAADATVTAVATGHTITRLVGYHDTGTASTSVLIWDDEKDSSGASYSQATNGGDIDIVHNASGIFDV